MAKTILEIWKNRKNIIEGIKNNTFKKEDVEHIANARMVICSGCDNIDRVGDKCFAPKTQPCCALCGCKLAWKIRSLSEKCDIDKWDAITTFEEEKEIKKELGIDDNS